MPRSAPRVHFQLLLRGAAAAAHAAAGRKGPPAAAPAAAAPSFAEASQATLRWLSGQGLAGFDAGAAVACDATPRRFRQLFGQPPSVPAALAEWVEAVEPCSPPEFFRPS